MLLNCGAGEDSLSSPLDYKEIQPVHPKGNQSWIFIGKTDAEAETPKLWSPDVKKWLIWKPWCWEKLKAGGERDDRGWIGWMGSLARWKWVWVGLGSWWCHPTISSSVVPFSSCLQFFPASGSFPIVSSTHQVAKVLELQLQHQSFQWIFKTDFL